MPMKYFYFLMLLGFFTHRVFCDEKEKGIPFEKVKSVYVFAVPRVIQAKVDEEIAVDIFIVNNSEKNFKFSRQSVASGVMGCEVSGKKYSDGNEGKIVVSDFSYSKNSTLWATSIIEKGEIKKFTTMFIPYESDKSIIGLFEIRIPTTSLHSNKFAIQRM